MIPVYAKIGIITLMGSVLVLIKGSQSTAPPPTPEQQYMIQVDKSNAALDKYLKLPCESDPKDIKAVSTELSTQMGNLETAYQNLPSNQDILVQSRETELFIGYIELVNKYVPAKIHACMGDKDKDNSTPNPAPVPAHNITS